MARRAQSSINPTHLLGLVLILAVLGGGGYTLLHRTTDPMTGITELLSSEFLENATALSGNLYKVEGVVDDRLDTGWRQSDGRLQRAGQRWHWKHFRPALGAAGL
jgi:hypothetical protein